MNQKNRYFLPSVMALALAVMPGMAHAEWEAIKRPALAVASLWAGKKPETLREAKAKRNKWAKSLVAGVAACVSPVIVCSAYDRYSYDRTGASWQYTHPKLAHAFFSTAVLSFLAGVGTVAYSIPKLVHAQYQLGEKRDEILERSELVQMNVPAKGIAQNSDQERYRSSRAVANA